MEDEDLKIVISSELEADEQASAKRISAQLPAISKLINGQNHVRIVVGLDESAFQNQTQKMAAQIDKKLTGHKVGVQLGLDAKSVQKIRQEMKALSVKPEITKAVTAELDKMGIQIDKITGKWERNAENQERLLTLTIRGTDQLGRNVTILQQCDEQAKNFHTQMSNVTMDIERQRKAQERLAVQAKADHEARITYAAKQKAALAQVRGRYAGDTAAMPVTGKNELAELNREYRNIERVLDRVSEASGRMGAQQKIDIDGRIRALDALAKKYQTLEYYTGGKSPKTMGQINAEQADALALYEEKLRSSNILTQEFQEKIGRLRVQLGSAFDQKSLDAYLSAFTQLDAEVGQFKEKIRGVGTLYQQMTAVDTKIAGIRSSMAKADPVRDSGRLEALRDELAIQELQREELNRQIQGYGEVGRLSEQYVRNTMVQLELTQKVATAEASAADTQREKDRKTQESKMAFVSRYRDSLKKLQAVYTGEGSVKPVTNRENLSALEEKYREINEALNTIGSSSGEVSQLQKIAIQRQIADLDVLTKKYQNLEYVSTRLRAKTVPEVKAEQGKGLNTFEDSLRKGSILTDDFKRKIAQLRTQLNGAFDRDSLIAYLDSFDRLKAEVGSFKAQVGGADVVYKQITELERKIGIVKRSMAAADPVRDQIRLASLNQELTALNEQKAALFDQAAVYQSVLGYSQQFSQYQRLWVQQEGQLRTANAAVADQAREATAAMAQMPSVIQDVEARFRAVENPTRELVHNVRSLNLMVEEFGKAKTEQEKVSIYDRLQKKIAACNLEMRSLQNVQRAGVNDFKLEKGIEKAKADLKTVGRQWSALKHDPGLNQQFTILEQKLARLRTNSDLKRWSMEFSAFKSEVRAVGRNVQSLGDIMRTNLGKVTQWMTATTMLFRALHMLQRGLQTVIDLDTAMIDLRKTTDATEIQYEKFYQTANRTAKDLNLTTKAVVEQTAEWSRLGYSMQEAAQLAENSAIFAAVSPEMGVEKATDGLVSVIKAFDIDVDDSMDGIISKVNAVGNAFAVSNKDIVEALMRSSSAMASANNTFDQTVALATAAIEITRDAEVVGTALKTMSMRIRGYDEETESYSEDVSRLTGEIADLTRVAGNNYKGISLFEENDPNTYRDTYTILKDIAEIQDEITDRNMAKLLETLFAKRQAQVGAAILSNFEQADAALQTMAESAGSADREMEIIKDSLKYKMNEIKQTWVSVSQNLFQKDDMQVVIGGFQALSDSVDVLTGKFGLFGTIALTALGIRVVKSVGGPKNRRVPIAPTYTLVVTRNEQETARGYWQNRRNCVVV